MVSTPEMVDSVNPLILTDRKVTLENISEQLGINVSAEQKNVYDDLDFS